ncbi:MAG: PEP-CTERM sorting domain-containing protein [Pirellulaceae bacterium]|nr:PEP-CTERM sorting domain-containing protein [Planctomycetales bacterium]
MSCLNLRNAALVALMFGVVVSAQTAQAAFITFDNGAGNNQWGTAVNWSNNSLPTTNDFVSLSNGQTVNITTEAAVGEYLDILGGATLNISGGALDFGFANNRWMWVGFTSPGTVVQTGGTVTGHGNNTDIWVDQYGTYQLLGGTISVPDDLNLDGGTFQVSGSATIVLGDDIRAFSPSTLEIELVGTTAPTIQVGGTLRAADLTLDIDTTQWSGAADVELFNVGQNVLGSFAAVNVNGQPVDPTNFSISGGSVMLLATPEPSSGLTALMAFGMVAWLVRRRVRR